MKPMWVLKPQLEIQSSSLGLDFVPEELSDVCEERITRLIQVTDKFSKTPLESILIRLLVSTISQSATARFGNQHEA